MKQSRIIGALVVVGLIALIVWVARHTYWEEISVPTPMQGEAATNPFYAAQRFVEELGIESQWERVLPRVPTDEVIVLSSWHWTLIEARQRRLEEWVENGGRLVADSGLIGLGEAFEAWSGIERQRARESDSSDEADSDAEDGDEDDGDDGDSPPVAPASGCRELHESTRSAESRAGVVPNLQLCGDGGGSQLIAPDGNVDWAMSDDTGAQVLRVKVGKGSVTLINGSPFRYRDFLLGDHAALLVAAAQLRRGDTVHFLSEEQHDSLISLMWTYGWPVVVLALALIGLALWRNSVRFGPIASDPELARRSLAEQIRGTGQFAVRFGGGRALHAAAVRSLDEAALRHVPAYPRLSSVERVEAIARMTGLDAATLGPAINHSGPRRLGELRQAIALIESARRRLQN